MSPKILQALRLLTPSSAQSLIRRRIDKIQRKLQGTEQQVLTFEPAPGVEVRGDVLVAYIIDAFALKKGPEPIDESLVPHSHTHWWESLQIVQTFLDLGYRVDAISWRNFDFVPTKTYKIALDVRVLLEHWQPHLPSDCIKILHAETSHWTVHNPAQDERLERLFQRRGRRVAPNKKIEENRALEVADCVTLIGEGADFVQESYAEAGKPLYPIPISTPLTWPVLDRDLEQARRRFVWFGSGGLVHKGLDLVLEAFSGMPEMQLTVCGPVQQERDFEREYWNELYRTPNIHLHGWIDVTSDDFVRLMSEHVAVVFPSCSEGQNGGVITCMHAGLIPVVSRATGAPISPERGIVLEDCKIETIRQTVRRIAAMDIETLSSMSRAAREHVRDRHNRPRFAETFRAAIEDILSRHDDRDGGES